MRLHSLSSSNWGMRKDHLKTETQIPRPPPRYSNPLDWGGAHSCISNRLPPAMHRSRGHALRTTALNYPSSHARGPQGAPAVPTALGPVSTVCVGPIDLQFKLWSLVIFDPGLLSCRIQERGQTGLLPHPLPPRWRGRSSLLSRKETARWSRTGPVLSPQLPHLL